MGSNQDVESLRKPSSDSRLRKMWSIVITIVALGSLAAAVAALWREEGLRHKWQHPQGKSPEDQLDVGGVSLQEINSLATQSQGGIRSKRSSGKCNVKTWGKTVCKTSHHNRRHAVGARVSLFMQPRNYAEDQPQKGYSDENGTVRWEYVRDDCVTLCMGLDLEKNGVGRYLRIGQDGIYNVRVQLIAEDHFALSLGLEIHVNDKLSSRIWFPNGPVVLNGTQVDHSTLVKSAKYTDRNGHAPRAVALSDHQKYFVMRVPISLSRLISLRHGDRISVKAMKLVPLTGGDDPFKMVPLELQYFQLGRSNFLEAFRI